ncbi:MAG TPA: cytochrome c biogenesis protein ResB [Chloroflexia bacterium]|nr:cytochrome c biogenesis protein ResB [Chloroflexia bacterium]
MAQSAQPVPRRIKPAPAQAREPVAAATQQRPRRDIVETVWTLFCSIRFAVVLNVALALYAMLGTVITQMQPGIQRFPSEFDAFMKGAEARYGAFSGLLYWAGFYDLYNSLPFRMLVVIVVFSIIICTMNRWQPTLRLITRPTVRVSDPFINDLTEKAQFRGVPLSVDEAERAVRQALRRGRYRVLSERTSDTSVHLFGDRDRWSKMVTFVSHAALVLLILTAAGFTQIGWREQSVYFVPGDRVDVGHGTDFMVANQGFEIEYYSDGTTVKEYRNTLAVYEGDTQVLTKTITVNDPLRYDGVNYFLVSYQPVLYVRATGPRGDELPLKTMGASGPITATTQNGEALVDFQYVSEDNMPMDLLQVQAEDAVLTFEVRYYQDVARLPGENPPAYVRVFKDMEFGSTLFEGFIPRTGPFVVPAYEDYALAFRTDTATILEVAMDPGLGLVGFWFTIMTLGFTISLYTTFTRAWARIVPNPDAPGTVNIVLGGLAEKNKVAFERDFEKLASRVSDALGAAAGKARLPSSQAMEDDEAGAQAAE